MRGTVNIIRWAMLRDSQSVLSEIVPVILAGGAGRRLWPLSTVARPKPFVRLGGGRSFLQKTAARVEDFKTPYVVCNARHSALVGAQLPGAQIILEPCGKNTAPAVAVAAHYLGHKGDPLLLVLPTDHAIRSPEVLCAAVAETAPLAREGRLVTFGIAPRHPSSHYGYIQAGEALGGDAFNVRAFVEKPDVKTARTYIDTGNYYWNSGIFLFSAHAYLGALKAQQPLIHDMAGEALRYASRLQHVIFLNEKTFSACPAMSIDYAVMENAPGRAVVPVDMAWRDLGTWPSLMAEIFKQ